MFFALRDLRRAWRRFVLVGLVVALVSVLSTVLGGLANGLVDDGISGLRALPLTHLAFEPGSQAVFSRSTLTEEQLRPWREVPGTEASPLGVTFVNAKSEQGGPSIDLALFGVPDDSFLAEPGEVRRVVAGEPGLVLAAELEAEGVEVGDRYELSGSGVTLPVAGFTDAGSYGHVPIAFTSLDTWRATMYGEDHRGRFSAIAVRTDDPGALAAVDRAAGTETTTKVEAYDGSPGYSAEMATMTLIRGFLLAISALIVGAFFTVLTVQRTRQIGLLKAMGASTGYVLRDGLGQLAIVVVVATVAGALLGTAIVAALQGGEVPVALSLGSVVTSAVVLAVTGVAGSLVAFRRIARIEPAVALGVES